MEAKLVITGAAGGQVDVDATATFSRASGSSCGDSPGLPENLDVAACRLTGTPTATGITFSQGCTMLCARMLTARINKGVTSLDMTVTGEVAAPCRPQDFTITGLMERR